VEKFFGQNGALANSFPEFEYREEQLQMAKFIERRLIDNENAMIEAGTGTGKTLAYLIPAIMHAKNQDKKVIISTETKALQKQLIDKEIPVVKKIMADVFKENFIYSLCLGSSNYVCIRRYELALQQGKFRMDEIESLKQIPVVLKKEKVYTRFDVKLYNNLLNQFCREFEICLGSRCGFSGECPYQKARKKWAVSDILVMNHYLFFSNIAGGGSYLPRADIVIFDEAHSLEEIGAKQLGISLSNSYLSEVIDTFYKKRRKNNLIAHISSETKKKSAVNLAEKILNEGTVFFSKAASLIPSGQSQHRILKELPFGFELLKLINDFLDLLSSVDSDFLNLFFKMELDIAKSRFEDILAGLDLIINHSQKDYVYWIESMDENLMLDCALQAQPIMITEIMRTEVFRSYDSTLLISATLAVEGNFVFFSSKYGIERNENLLLSSPFDYMNQAVLFIARELSEPTEPIFIKQSANIAAEIIKTVNGNCLMLFTSYKMLENVRRELGGLIENRIYSQGDMPVAEAVELYLSDENSILMGTHSFWQGIDFKGDLLRAVILMRLPFSVPDSPPLIAKAEYVTELGLNPFAHLQIPEAVIKFKQGFGRLIRSCNDKGVIAVLDSRLYSKGYGKRFLDSLPKCKTVFDPTILSDEYKKMMGR
jgi:ATP-dependent DNA helicase DinG